MNPHGVSLGEIAGATIWAASAVAVAGYTWQAYVGEYRLFQTIPDTGGQLLSDLANIPITIAKDAIGGIGSAAGGLVSGVAGTVAGAVSGAANAIGNILP